MKPLKFPSISSETLTKFKHAANRGSMFYYTEDQALAAKKILETLHETKHPVRIRPVQGRSLATIRQQFYQGTYFLLDNLDPNGLYRRYFEQTKASIATNEYVEFTYKEASDTALNSLEVVVPWREDFMIFLDTAGPNMKFYRSDISLSLDDLTWINNQLAGLVKPSGDPMFFGEIEIGKPLVLIRDVD